jgi:hypothetical protein
MSPRNASFSVVSPPPELDDVPLAVDPAAGVEPELLLPPHATPASSTTAHTAKNNLFIANSSN